MLNVKNLDENSLTVIFVFLETQLAENPRAASLAVAKPLIVDMLLNTISPLFQVSTAGLRKLGRYSYDKRTRPRISIAVSALLARSITFFSG